MNSNLGITSILKRFNYRDLIIGIFPILIFLFLYLFSYNPGILNGDSFNLLHQIATGEFTNAYPIFYTFIVMICLKIYASPITVGILQILVFSVMWMIICKYHRDDSTSNQFVYQFVVTFIICLIPINAVNSITLSNLTLFSYSLMFLGFLIKVMLDKQGKLDLKWIIIIAVTIALVSGLNRYGIYIASLSLIAMIIYLYHKNQSKNLFMYLSILAVIGIVLIASLNIVYDVGESKNPTIKSDEGTINIDNAKSQYFSSINESPTESFEDVTQTNIRTTYFHQVNTLVSTFQDNVILNTLFNNPLVYMILAIIALGFVMYATKSNEIFLIYVPNLINIIIVFIASPTYFNFNLYSNLLIFYMVIIILLSIWFNVDLKQQKNVKRPAVAEEINNTQYAIENPYRDIEYELEDLTVDDINEMLGKTPETSYTERGVSDKETSSDLVESILEEIEMEKQDK